MNKLTTLAVLSGLGLAVAVQAQMPPAPTDTTNQKPITQGQTQTDRSEHAFELETDRAMTDERDLKDWGDRTHQGALTQGDSDRMTLAMQQRDSARTLCQGQAQAQRQPCLDRANRDYADQARELGEQDQGNRR